MEAPRIPRPRHGAAIAALLALAMLTAGLTTTASDDDVAPIVQETKFTLGDPDQNAHFGFSVDTDGDRIAASRPGDPVDREVVILQRDALAWTEQARVSSPLDDDGDQFGFSVAIQGPTLVVGAPATDVNGMERVGAAHVFEGGSDGFSHVAQLTPEPPSAGAAFGHAIAIDGDHIIAGAPSEDVGASQGGGAAYVFERDVGGWSQADRLTVAPRHEADTEDESDGLDDDLFGSAVDVDGERLVIGAESDDTPVSDDLGAAYIFELAPDGGGWTEVAWLYAADADAEETDPDDPCEDGEPCLFGGEEAVSNADPSFGKDVAIDGDRVAVGEPNDDQGQNATDAGRVNMFVLQEGTWARAETFVDPDPIGHQKLGWRVGLDGDTLIAGQPQRGEDVLADIERYEDHVVVSTGNMTGAISVWDQTDDGWVHQARLIPAQSDKLGWSAAIDDATIVGGAYLDDEDAQNAGAVFVFGPDHDRDGLASDAERSAGTEPFLADTDGDGLTDKEEVAITKTSPLLPDTDLDGVPDGAEDPDADGLSNRAELHDQLTDPLDPDTDGDLHADGTEVHGDSDPLDPASIPTPVGATPGSSQTHGTQLPITDGEEPVR